MASSPASPPAGFALGAKDNRLPLASLIRDRMLAALAQGLGELDWAAFARVTAAEAGMPSSAAP